MASIAQIVEEKVLEQPFLADALQRGLLNYGAVADELLPRVQKETKREATHAAVMMALRRFGEKLERQEVRIPRFTERSSIALQSDIVELTTTKTKEAFDAIRAFRDHVSQESGDLLTVTQGMQELTIITNKAHLPELRRLLEGAEVKRVIEELSLLAIRIPDAAVETPGYFYALLKALAWEGINIVEIVSTLTELAFILKDEDVPRAYRVVKDVLAQ